MTRKRTLALLALLALFLWWRWRAGPDPDHGAIHLQVLIVDYTVPFENYREHEGFIWVLNHLGVPGPGRGLWRATDYLGYHPDQRDKPERVTAASLVGRDVVMLADTYGVYRDDLAHIEEKRAHRDFSPLIFGGLEMSEAMLLSDFVRDGGALLTEFNAFCEPTSDAARTVMEELSAVHWSGWVGRVFADPYDPEDTPAWLVPEFERQYPGRQLAHTPHIVFISDAGKLIAFQGDELEDVTPRVLPTESGRVRFALGDEAPPYYSWFPLFSTLPGGHTHARWVFPSRDDIRSFLEREKVDSEPPALVERRVGAGRVLSLVGEFGDLDFEPPPHDQWLDTNAAYKKEIAARTGPSSAPVYWGFFVPVVSSWLREVARPATRK